MEYNEELHSQLLEVGRKIERGVTHKIEDELILTILKTFEHFDAPRSLLGQIYSDLVKCRFKIYDWLGMMYSGRCEIPNDPATTRKIHKLVVEPMVKLYININHVGGWAWSLTSVDLDVTTPYLKRKQSYVDDYEHWHNQTSEERLAEQEAMIKAFGGNVIHID